MANTKRGPTFRERALFLLSPKRGSAAYQKRLREEQEQDLNSTEPRRFGSFPLPTMNYAGHGASQTLTSMIGWQINAGSAEDDIDENGATLRKRSRDLYTGGGLARSGPTTLTTSVVGWGIQPKPKIDGDFLGLSEEQQEEIERQILREFTLWANNPMCDAERQQTFYELQQLAFLSMLVSGDVFVLFGFKENKRTPYQLTIRLLEADRISTPDSGGESEIKETDDGGRIVDGVEINREGEVKGYHIANHHPLAGHVTESLEWVFIKAYSDETGEPNILHVMTHERPEQRRGVPFVAAEIEQLKQFDRYMKSELAANLVSSMLTAFVTSKEDDGKAAFEDAVNDDEKVSDDELHLELAPGAIYDLPPGKSVTTVNPLRSNTAFEAFVNTTIMTIASSMGIPKEVLVKKYESNYTAARAALLDFWRTVRVYRTRFNSAFNQAIYEQWLAEAIAAGRIEAPGFFDDPAIRQAWCGCVWMGASMGHVDPLKEVNAAAARIANNITTQEQEASEYNGNDWAANVRQRRRELEAMREFADITQEHDGTPNSQDTDDYEDEEDEE